MMNLEQLKLLCATGETKTLEYKTSTATLRSAFETICAFLNGKGGTVLFGVKDDGKIVGQHVSESTKKDVAKEIARIEPTAPIEVDYIDIGSDKFVIAIRVEPGNHTPYIYDGRAWQREESETQRMSQHRYEQLLVKRGYLNHSWEEFPADGYEIEQLDKEEIYRAVEQGIRVGRVPASIRNSSIKDILINWNLVSKEEGTIKNAAAVLFAKEVLPNYLQCHIKLGRFRGTNMLKGFIDNKDFYGNAFQILEEANYFLMRHLPIASFFEINNLERIDKPALPVLAVREALVNAICHRDYSYRSSSITLAIFDDRVEIWNKGELPLDLDMKHLNKKHRSEPRNKNIAKVFYDRKYFEGWGTGITNIFDLCREHEIPPPEYEQYSGGTEIIFKFKEPISVTYVEKVASNQNLSSRQQMILAIIKARKAVNLKQIIAELDNPPSDRMIRNDLNTLRKYGLIGAQGLARNTVWILNE